MITLNPLTDEEKDIIINKSTERPFTGDLLDEKRSGTFVCKQCDNPLYFSDSKFDSRCGRPSFDDTIPGAVEWIMDKDGRKTEIVCNKCKGHLGHVFVGEHMTEKNTRHCVNSLSIKFVQDQNKIQNIYKATLGAGCFWCVESVFKNIKGILQVYSGYSGGHTSNPTYEEVCKEKGGHIEVVQITFDNTVIDYQTILDIFFTIHDPTTLNRQGNDMGTQYASVIFRHDMEQKNIADNMIKKLESEQIFDKAIVTKVIEFQKFWIAESYHQNFFENNPTNYYCNAIINPKLEKLRSKFKNLIK